MRPVLALLLILALPKALCADARLLDGVAAYVNDRVITIGEVNSVFLPQVDKLKGLYEGEELRKHVEDAYRDSLDRLIERHLIVSAYERKVAAKEIKIPESVIEQRVDELLKRATGNDQDALTQDLVKEGMTMQELRKPFRERVIATILQSIEVEEKVVVTPKEIRDSYFANSDRYVLPARIKLRMIELSLPKDDAGRERVRAKAAVIRQDLVAGGDFSDAAKAASDGRLADKGGEWGWTELTDLQADLSAALDKLAPGAISEVVEVEDKIYVMRVDDRKDSGLAGLDEVQQQIEEDLRRKKLSTRYAKWMAQLKSSSYIKIVEPSAAARKSGGSDS